MIKFSITYTVYILYRLVIYSIPRIRIDKTNWINWLRKTQFGSLRGENTNKIKMRRKLFEEDTNEMGDFTKWYSLHDTGELKEARLRRLKNEEREWVREGACAECGAFDILSRVRNTFLCNSCMDHLNNNHKNNGHRKK